MALIIGRIVSPNSLNKYSTRGETSGYMILTTIPILSALKFRSS